MPNVNANSDGDFNFNLGNFENDWDDENVLLVFRDVFDFSRHLRGGSFLMQALLPPAKHPANIVQQNNKRSVADL